MLDFGIDCAPCTPRPDVRAQVVFEKLGIEYVKPYEMLFGAWRWKVPCTKEQYDSIKEWLEVTMDEMVNKDLIRGAVWNYLEN